ncbi:MAG: hypothetical protein LBT22_08450 [Peptococcaceae bacterium]|jgi:hypothetical protein|nr:hypothetical protein [Peptococcaceae bacterium]
MLFTAFNAIIRSIGVSLSAILAVLPNSPFTWDLSAVDNSLLQIFVWIIPIQGMITTVSVWVGSVAIYYSIRTVLRWAKVVGS